MPNSKSACLSADRELSIIIVNYRSEQYLKKCVASLFNHLKNINFEIIVVNNDKEDIKEMGGVRIMRQAKNRGFGAGCNAGAQNAQGKILWFLNPDTEIIAENIVELMQEFNKNVAIIGPRLVDKNGKTQEWIAGKKISALSIILNNLGCKRDKKIWESKETIECGWVTGGAMFVQKELFEKIGGFDENFFLYFEDVDFCRRARKAGYAVLYYPKFSARHFGGKSQSGLISQKKHYYKSLFQYLRKK